MTRTRTSFRSLARWYWPYVRPFRAKLALVSLGLAIVLACQALIPLTVESLMHHGHWETRPVLFLVAMVIIQLGIGHVAHVGGHAIASSSATLLRIRIFRRTMNSDTLHGQGLARSSVVSRHTTDVDHVSEAFEQSVNNGIPGILRVVISLALLTVLSWPAGIVMTIASLLFVLLRASIGRSVARADRARLDASSRVGESVDETLSAPRVIAGLHLTPWLERRFARRAEDLEHASHRLGGRLAGLITGAHAAGLAGLLAVVFFGIAIGGSGLASVAAALLYVEGVVKGLEALPAWVRDVQLAFVSRDRIDQILISPVGGRLEEARMQLPRGEDIAPPPGTTALVTAPGLDPDTVLAVLVGGDSIEDWRLSLDGHPIRRAGVKESAWHVPVEPLTFNASIHDYLTEQAPGTTPEHITHLLDELGLGHLDRSVGTDIAIGAAGSGLSIDERQRLALAIALAVADQGRCDTLLIGPIQALTEVESARVLLSTIASHDVRTIVVSARTSEIAAALDHVIYSTETEMKQGTHEQMLLDDSTYADLWATRLSNDDVDLAVLGIPDDARTSMLTQLVTERHRAGETIYQAGSPADRIFFIVAGSVEILAVDSSGRTARVALLGPGSHCGDLRLTPGEVRSETAVAVEDAIVRTLSRTAISAGMGGMLDRTDAERRILSRLLRVGPQTLEQLTAESGLEPTPVLTALRMLESDGAIENVGDTYAVVSTRSTRPRGDDLWERLF